MKKPYAQQLAKKHYEHRCLEYTVPKLGQRWAQRISLHFDSKCTNKILPFGDDKILI
jgi:hypothetical protein